MNIRIVYPSGQIDSESRLKFRDGSTIDHYGGNAVGALNVDDFLRGP